MEDCLFCKIAAGDIPSKKLYEDEQVVAFYDIAPQAKVHFLVIPKKHIPSAAALTEEDGALLGHVFAVIAKLAREQGLDNGYRAADRLILPGVGAFGDAMAKLEATGLVPVIKGEAAKKPLLGICLGMQLLFEKSYEYGEHDGLGFVPGQVCPLAPDLGDKSLKVPQIGWNAVHILRDDPLFKYVRDGEYFYYVHSYYGKHCAANTLAVSDYSLPVTGVVKEGKVYGTQFHPEKSGDAGLRLLKAFSEL